MAAELPQRWQNSSCEKAWQILAGLSHYRIDPSIIQAEAFDQYRGSRGIVGPAKFIGLPETRTASTLLPGAQTAPFLEVTLSVKKLGWNRDDAEESTKFFKCLVNELSIMATLSHPNIIQLIGFVEDMEKGDAWVIEPWAENGNVREFLQSGEWDIPERISLIQDVACGLEYLHTREPPICHGDLKSLNILVNSSYRAVITDFGSARIKRSIASLREETRLAPPHRIPVNGNDFDEVAGLTSSKVEFDAAASDLTLTGPMFSLRWTAPEVLCGEEQGLTSDIWSIGWICWEITTGRLPYEGLNRETAIIMRTIKGDLPHIRDHIDLSCVLQLCSLMSHCWALEPANRINVSTFRRKVRFVPSLTPSYYTFDGVKVRPVALLMELGRMHSLQNNTAEAEEYYRSALQGATPKDDTAKADALIGLGEIYNACSRFQEAEQSFMESHDIHSRIGNDLGTANALVGLGESYNARSRYQDAEKAFTASQEIHSRIGNDLGAANALVGLGESFNTRSRYREAEESFTASHEIHSRIGNDLGVANTLVGLGNSYNNCSRYQEAEKAFRESHEIYSRIGNHLGAANAMVGLGEIYNAQSRYQDAEKAFMESHEIYTRISNQLGAASAIVGLGEIYSAQSRYQDAEKAFRESHEIYSLIGNHLGAANAMVGLGEIYSAQSRYQDAEKAFMESHEIYTRIGSPLGAANAMVGLGEIFNAQSRYQDAEKAFSTSYEVYLCIGSVLRAANTLVRRGESYNTQSRYQEAEKTFKASHEVHSQIGNDLGAANALMGLGEGYNARSRHQEAEKAFKEAYDIHSRIGSNFGVANALMGLGEIYTAQSRYEEAKNTFKQAREICSHTGSQVGLARAGILLYETYNAQSNFSEADEAFKEVPGILSRLENEISPNNAPNHPEEDSDTRSVYSEDEETREDHCSIEHDAKTANAPEEAPPSFLIVPVADTPPNSRLQEKEAFDEPTMSAQIAALATEDVFELIQALEKVAPKAVRNKHKTYSILRISRDICNLIIEIGDPPECQAGIEVKPLLTRTEDYCALLDALEETLLELAETLHSDITTSGADLYSSWSQSRFAFVRILTKLCQPPFPDASSPTQDIADDLFFDDCSWLSRLIRRVVQPEISSQFPDVPKSHPLFAVTDGLQYLETQVKCRVPDGPTRELIIDIATLLAQTLARISAEDDDESLQEQSSLYSEADRDWLVQALADSFSVLHLDSTLQPSTARELAIKWADVRAGFISRCPNALGN